MHIQYVLGILTDRWNMALASTEELVALTCTCNLKIECVIKLTTLFRAEEEFNLSLSICWHNPTITNQPVVKKMEIK